MNNNMVIHIYVIAPFFFLSDLLEGLLVTTYLLYVYRIGQLMDGLKEKLEGAYKASGGRKVNIISHSMGGLLVSCFVSLHSEVC